MTWTLGWTSNVSSVRHWLPAEGFNAMSRDAATLS